MKSLLRHLREESGLGQAAFASIIGASQSYVSDIERGYRDMSPGFAMKAAPGLGVDPVVLLCGYEYEMIARKAEEGDASAPSEALALAQKLLELLEEPGAFGEERAAQVRQIVEKLLELVESGAPTAPRVPPVKPVAPVKPAAKASSGDGTMSMLRRLGGMSRVGGLDEDEAYDRVVEAGLSSQALEQLLDDISARMSGSLISAAERLSLEAIQAAAERRIAELAGDGDRSSFAEQVGDRAAVKARNSAEAQERRDHAESMRELGLDQYGRVIPRAQRDHDKALKSASFLTQAERELGVDRRGLPITPQRLRDRRYVELGE